MSFSEASLLKKIHELNNTQQSVQSVSLWLIHHRKHSRTIVKIWLKELINSTKSERKLTFIYLANDMLQNSRKKGYEYMTEFSTALCDAIENTAKYSDEKVRFTLERILNIWKDRKIYPDEKIEEFKKILHSTKSTEILNSPPLVDEVVDKSNESNKKSINKTTVTKMNNNKQKLEDESQESNLKKKKLSPDTKSSSDINAKTNAPVKISLREEVMKELAQNGSNLQPPDSTELINLLQELEKSASSDAVVREKIAELPSKLSDVNEIQNLKDKAEAFELSKTVTEAITLLDNYNTRLSQELVSRKQTALLLAAFIRHQNNEIENDQKQIEEWQKKLKQVESVKHELQNHLASLPDLSSIDELAELTPLPSAGDLFSS